MMQRVLDWGMGSGLMQEELTAACRLLENGEMTGRLWKKPGIPLFSWSPSLRTGNMGHL